MGKGGREREKERENDTYTRRERASERALHAEATDKAEKET